MSRLTSASAVLSVVVTVLMAWASWLLVERLTTRLRRLVPTSGRTSPVVPVDVIAPAQ